MKGRIKHFSASAIQHIYQRAEDRGVIFYSVEDRLVYYTLAAVKAKKHHIRVFSASIMFTHLHQGVQASSLTSIHKYLHDVDTSFARTYNARYSRRGRLFEKPPGRSQKYTSKDKRSNTIYIFNNHVEKKLCHQAVQERWSFLAYAASDHPFSVKLERKKASPLLRKSLRLVDRRVTKLTPLEYKDLDRILPRLSTVEYEQFIDYVISRYSLIDFDACISLFGDLDSTIIAVNSTTGNEHEMSEEYVKESDIPYPILCSLAKEGGINVFNCTNEERSSLVFMAWKRTSATKHQLEKFLHFKFSSNGPL